ncbi:MAG: peroxiredoxin, partial [Gammaproteobacteria bacterium]|nr:peroxiredoxin [Gammaproteobacteria bacterium]
MSLVSRKAPNFKVPAVLPNGEIGTFDLHDSIKDKYAVLVFYPLDFTFVCPSELIALEHRMKELKERGVVVISVSIDSHFTHAAWRNTPIDKGGIGHVSYTMVADINHQITREYGVEHPEMGVAFRATFVIDRNGVVRHELVNDLPIGRNMDEIARIV